LSSPVEALESWNLSKRFLIYAVAFLGGQDSKTMELRPTREGSHGTASRALQSILLTVSRDMALRLYSGKG
jgi:hypothetical protein